MIQQNYLNFHEVAMFKILAPINYKLRLIGYQLISKIRGISNDSCLINYSIIENINLRALQLVSNVFYVWAWQRLKFS